MIASQLYNQIEKDFINSGMTDQWAKQMRLQSLEQHYSSGKFACISVVDYFSDLGLRYEFIKDIPVMEDI